MKPALAIVLAALVLLHPISRVCAVLDYQLRKDFIAKVLCINKDKPMSGCSGKCYLKKRLAQTDAAEQKAAQTATQKDDWINVRIFSVRPVGFAALADKPRTTYTAHYSSQFLSRIFHPPQSAIHG